MARNQRHSERVQSRVEVRVREAGGTKTIKGVTTDISEDGLFIQTQQPLPAGTAVEVELLHRDHSTEMDGVVVRASEMPAHLQGLQDSGMGVKVVRPGMPDGDAEESARHSPRISPDAEATVFFGSERRHLALHDLSTTGVALLSDRPLPDISFVRLLLKLTRESEPAELEGVPVRTQPVGRGTLIAIRFLDPPADVVARIAAFVARRSVPPPGAEEE